MPQGLLDHRTNPFPVGAGTPAPTVQFPVSQQEHPNA